MKISLPVKFLLPLTMVLMLLLSACAQVQTPASSTPSSTPTTVPSPVSTPGTTSPTPQVPTVQSGPYGAQRIAVPTFGKEILNPVTVTISVTTEITSPLYDTLFGTAKSQLTPGIIESWQIAPDGKSWMYGVRKGIKFQNGDDVTPADIKFSIEQYFAPNASTTETKTMVDHVDVVDANTVQVYTKGTQPYLPYMQTIAAPGQGVVMPKNYIESHGWPYAENNPMGSGPYKFVRHVSGDMFQYEAVNKHWLITPEFKTLSIILMPEEATRIASLKTGALDISSVSLDAVPGLEANGYKTVVTSYASAEPLIFESYDSRAASMPVSDIRVRKALAISINRDAIIKNLFFGKANPPMPPGFGPGTMEIDEQYWQKYCADLYKYDPALAKQLVKDAGYPNGFSIKLYNMSMAGAPFLAQIAQAIAADWNQIGVKTEVVPIDQAVYSSWLSRGKGSSAQLVGQVALYRASVGASTPRVLERYYLTTGIQGLLSKAMPQMDALINSSYTETDAAKRKQILADATKLGIDTYVAFQVCSAPNVTLTSSKVDIGNWPIPLMTNTYGCYAMYTTHRK